MKDCDVQVDIVPRLYDMLGPKIGIHTIEGMPLIGLPPMRFSRSSYLLKRGLDLSVSLIGLLLLLPVFAVVAAAILVESGRPVFFRQVRMGYEGRPFRIYKFRTMVRNADERKAEVAHLNRHARPGGDARMFKIENDPRTTRVGRLLRKYSIDELPQLINVVTGDMSLVGPRPLIPEEDQYVREWARQRMSLKPGITGPWQVYGKSNMPFGEMVKLDYHYVTGWSLANDCRLLLRTLPLVVSGSSPD
jgi:lipopolysaccharide/colanic/teichoic acid biosynthesis glycosyltransferase